MFQWPKKVKSVYIAWKTKMKQDLTRRTSILGSNEPKYTSHKLCIVKKTQRGKEFKNFHNYEYKSNHVT